MQPSHSSLCGMNQLSHNVWWWNSLNMSHSETVQLEEPVVVTPRCVCVCVCVRVRCVCVSVSASACACACTQARASVLWILVCRLICSHINVLTYQCLDISLIHALTHMYTCTHTYIYMHSHICIHAFTHMYIHSAICNVGDYAASNFVSCWRLLLPWTLSLRKTQRQRGREKEHDSEGLKETETACACAFESKTFVGTERDVHEGYFF